MGNNRSKKTKEELDKVVLLSKWEEYWILMIDFKRKFVTRDAIREILDKRETWTNRSLSAEEAHLFARLENRLEL